MPAKTKEVPKKGDVTRLTIEKAAYELFMEQGYHATSMRQISERAKLALGGIYNHFSNKEEIFKAIIIDRHPYKRILPLILAAEGDTAEEFIHNSAQALVSELGKQPDFLKLMFIEIVEFDAQHVNLFMDEIVPQILPVFEKVAKVRKNLRNLHPVILLRSFLGMFFSYYIMELLLKGSAVAMLLPKNSFEQIVDIYLHGVIKESK
ncbi:MAG: TetR/AcrR family transcriptional regulator [Anaerolineales bacterium]|nr:TetR/AcrR family transcriptional regulator [Anaerolineales bacterium]